LIPIVQSYFHSYTFHLSFNKLWKLSDWIHTQRRRALNTYLETKIFLSQRLIWPERETRHWFSSALGVNNISRYILRKSYISDLSYKLEGNVDADALKTYFSAVWYRFANIWMLNSVENCYNFTKR
jgi:hypothetical protein